MSKATTRPDATISNNWTVTGAATAHAALADNSDASYLQFPSGLGASVWLGFAEPVIPAGAVIKSDQIRSRRCWPRTRSTTRI
jgi:hypothetical protein